MSVLVDDDRWGAFVQRLAPVLPELERWVEVWLRRQATRLVGERQFNGLVVVAERFPQLTDEVRWVFDPFGRELGCEVPRCVRDPVVAVAAMAVAVRAESRGAEPAWTAPDAVHEALLRLWHGGRGSRRHDVTAPEVAAAYLSTVWAPPGAPPFRRRWEPAALLLEAITYKMVHHGMHTLAGAGVRPWARRRHTERSRFAAQTVAGTHRVAVWLVTDREAGVPAWNWEERTLWEFVSGAVLGPARAGGNGTRPQPAAFPATLFGRWAEAAEGTTAGTVEVFACPVCCRVHGRPSCPASPGTTPIAVRRRNLFVAPRDRLADVDREHGHVRVERKVCKNGTCAETLRAIVGWAGAEPIYPTDLDECPYCHCRAAGQRPAHVWTRFP